MATLDEFSAVAAYLSASVNKPMTAEQLEVYYDALQVFDAVTLQQAAREVVKVHQYPTLPTVGQVYAVACVLWRRQRDAEAQRERLAWSGPRGLVSLSGALDALAGQLRLTDGREGGAGG